MRVLLNATFSKGHKGNKGNKNIETKSKTQKKKIDNRISKKTILPLKNFFVSYRKTKLKKGQFIHSIIIPIFKKNIFKTKQQ